MVLLDKARFEKTSSCNIIYHTGQVYITHSPLPIYIALDCCNLFVMGLVMQASNLRADVTGLELVGPSGTGYHYPALKFSLPWLAITSDWSKRGVCWFLDFNISPPAQAHPRHVQHLV